MTLNQRELYGSQVTRAAALRFSPYEDGIKPGKFAAISGAPILPQLTPIYWDDTTSTWKVWVGEGSEVNTITAASTAGTGGTFTLTVNGVTSAAIAFDATAAIVQAALEAMSNIVPGDVTAVATTGANLGANNAVVTLNWGGNFAGENVAITGDFTGVTGNDHVLATTTQGGIAPADGSTIDAFLADVTLQTSATETVLGNVFFRGILHAADVPLPSGESQADLNQALRAGLRAKGLVVDGLADTH